jgi:hypothetical protein
LWSNTTPSFFYHLHDEHQIQQPSYPIKDLNAFFKKLQQMIKFKFTFNGFAKPHGCPPTLAFIWMTSFVQTDINPLLVTFFERKHWDGTLKKKKQKT